MKPTNGTWTVIPQTDFPLAGIERITQKESSQRLLDPRAWAKLSWVPMISGTGMFYSGLTHGLLSGGTTGEV